MLIVVFSKLLLLLLYFHSLHFTSSQYPIYKPVGIVILVPTAEATETDKFPLVVHDRGPHLYKNEVLSLSCVSVIVNAVPSMVTFRLLGLRAASVGTYTKSGRVAAGTYVDQDAISTVTAGSRIPTKVE